MSGTRTVRRAALALLLMVASWRAARAFADEPRRLGIGLYAPSAPFEGPEARLAFVTGLAEHLQARIERPVVGRVFARAADLAAAVKKGEVQLVLVDAPNAPALGGGFAVLGVAVRNVGAGAAQVAWELVATDAVRDLRDLRGKTVAVPAAAGHESAFLVNAMLENEVTASYFGKVTAAPDALSAAAAVSVGRADAAIVPGGLALPSGVHRVATLRDLPWPTLALAPGVDDATRRAIAAALPAFRSAGVFSRFEPAPPGMSPFSFALAPAVRRGPMAVPAAARLEVKGVLSGRTFAIEPTELTPLVEAPRRK